MGSGIPKGKEGAFLKLLFNHVYLECVVNGKCEVKENQLFPPLV